MGDDDRARRVVSAGGKHLFRIRLRLDMGGIFLGLGLVLLGVGIGVLVTTGSNAASEGRPVLPVVGLLWVWIGWRIALASVIADRQGVTVHNFGRSYSIPWAHVVEFRSIDGKPCLIAADRDRPLRMFGISQLYPLLFQLESKRLLAELSALAVTQHADASTPG